MIFFICGTHGSGKTTLIDNIKLETPTVKVLDLDLSKKVLLNNLCPSNQFLRHAIFFDVLNRLTHLPNDYIILVDRSPHSLNIYDKSFKQLGLFDNHAYNELEKDYKDKLKVFNHYCDINGQDCYTVILDPAEETIVTNIKERGRDASLREDDMSYLRLIKSYYSAFEKDYAVDNIYRPVYEQRATREEYFRNVMNQVRAFIKSKSI